jgi:hypothetical protein
VNQLVLFLFDALCLPGHLYQDLNVSQFLLFLYFVIMNSTRGVPRLYAALIVLYLSILPPVLCSSSDRLATGHLADSISRRTDCPTNKCGAGCGKCAADECCSSEV